MRNYGHLEMHESNGILKMWRKNDKIIMFKNGTEKILNLKLPLNLLQF